MDSFEFNKIAGALLGTLLFVLGIGILSEILFHVEGPEIPGYAVILPDSDTMAGGEAPEETPLAVLLASADTAKGEKSVKKCAACHSFDEGGGNKVGPNLYNIVNRTMAAVSGFAYSDALKAAAAEGRSWTFEELDGFLESPKKDIPGTSMGFAGLRKDGERADVILYLRNQSSSPVPLPEPPSGDEQAAVEPAAAESPAVVETEDKAAADAAMPKTETPVETAASDSTDAASEDAAKALADGQQMAATTPAAPEAPTAEKSTDAAGDDSTVLAMISGADVDAGKKVSKKCAACHSFDEGGKNKVGPALWDSVNRPIGSVEGYKYSKALLAFAEGGKSWTYDLLAAYLADPKGTIKGGKMAFAGVKKPEDLAALLAYMASLSANPVPPPQ